MGSHEYVLTVLMFELFQQSDIFCFSFYFHSLLADIFF